jgi:hypothetical protein
MALLTSACSPTPRQAAEAHLRSIGAERMRKESAVLYKNLFASTAPAFTVIKADAWPPSFRGFSPIQVGAYRDGFSLALQRTSGAESGVYVVPEGMELEPRSQGRAHFDRIAEGIYWYVFEP